MLCLHALSNSNSIRNERTRFNDEFRYRKFEQDMASEDYWLLKGNVYSMLPSIRPLQFNIAITLLSWSQDSWHSIQKNVDRSGNLAASWNKSERLVNVGDVAIYDTSSIDQSARRFFMFFFFFFSFFCLRKKKRNWKRTFRRWKVHSIQSDLQCWFLSFRPTFGLPFSISNSFLFQISLRIFSDHCKPHSSSHNWGICMSI